MLQEPSTLLLCIRHGETDWNVARRVQGHTDIELNARGLAQAAALARALAGQTLHAVYSSDLRRARRTAEPLARERELPLHFEPALRERAFGSFEGRSFTELETLHAQECERWRRRDPDWGAPGGGEALQAFRDRVQRALLSIARRHRGQTVAVVTHGGALDCLYRIATGQDLSAPRTWELRNAAINRLLVSEDHVGLVGWNDCGHLDEVLDESGY
ncbi:MAG: histidine phosphatase family protein [Betaproteobacteria bacterium]|nr:histidine phosphatase family protein [Betaproteobacteria bacterium]